MEESPRIAVFVSGGGSNLQSLIDASKSGRLSGKIVLVISNNADAYGLVRATTAGIDTFVYNVKSYPTKEAAHQDLLEMLEEYNVNYIALAGYLKLLPASLVKKYKGHITNIHPALLPKFGGSGMYGHYVHEAVIAAGEKESGATVHLVDEIYDHGKILMQGKVTIEENETPDSLAAKVLKVEHRIYPEALENLIQGNFE
jgi:phosphoribosylglycinamide formyltransferase-1